MKSLLDSWHTWRDRSDSTIDFRSQRAKLPPEAFAFSEGPDPPPSDLVEDASWRGITSLPDDVALRTSDHHGTDLKQAYTAWGEWVSVGLALQYLDGSEPTTDSPVVIASFVITDELQSSLYSALCGFYRASIGDLRLALEGAVAGLRFTVAPDPAILARWQQGTYELRINEARQSLARLEPCARYPALIGEKQWLAESFCLLNGFSHGKPSTANVELWGGSNGPVYVKQSFDFWRRTFANTVLLVVLLTGLAEPRLFKATFPSDFQLGDFIAKLLHWHPSPPAVAADIVRDLTR